MKIYKIANAPSRLKDYAEIRTNFSDADFWIIRKGSVGTVGTPVKEFSPEHIGVKVTDTEVLLPDYLYYAIMNMHASGAFKVAAMGTTKLMHIRAEDIANIVLQ